MGGLMDMKEVYPDDYPQVRVVLDCGPMSISHWGLIDLGRFGAVDRGNGLEWHEDGEPMEVGTWR